MFSFLRLVQTSIEDIVYAVGSFRIRQYFLGLDPAAAPFFPPTDHGGGPGVGGAVLAYQVRRFRRAATVVPELYEGQSPDMPGW